MILTALAVTRPSRRTRQESETAAPLAIANDTAVSDTPTGDRTTIGFWPRNAKSASTRHRIRHTAG